MGHPINEKIIRARAGTVVERERAEVSRVVPRDGISFERFVIRFVHDIIWFRRSEYVVKSFTNDEEVGEHGHFVDVGRPLSSLDEAIEVAQSLAARRKMRPDGENACEAHILISDHALIEVPEGLKEQLYDSYRNGSDPVYLPVGEDWWRADPAALARWLGQPPFERDMALIERLHEPRPVFQGPVWSSRWTSSRCAVERERVAALAVPPAV